MRRPCKQRDFYFYFEREIFTFIFAAPANPLERKASYTSSTRPHTLVAEGLIHWSWDAIKARSKLC
jgi:hypothetical protein